MKAVLFIILIISSPLLLEAQFIIAGQHSPTDYYLDIPDTVISTPPNSTKTFSIDINGDGTIDFDFQVNWIYSSGSHANFFTIVPRNNNQIVFDQFDTCNHSGQSYLGADSMAKSFNSNDTISNNSIWSTSSKQYLSLYSYSGIGSNYYACQGGSFLSNPTFLGLRVFSFTDTLYGWIKVNGSNTLYEYACNAAKMAMNNLITEAGIKTYPNPVSSILNIEIDGSSNFTKPTLEVTNMLGQIVFAKRLPFISKYQVDLSFLNPGVYTLKLLNGTNSAQRKLIKE